MHGGRLCTRSMLYDGQEVTYTLHMLKLGCVWYTYGKPLEVNHTYNVAHF